MKSFCTLIVGLLVSMLLATHASAQNAASEPRAVKGAP